MVKNKIGLYVYLLPLEHVEGGVLLVIWQPYGQNYVLIGDVEE